MVKRVQVQREQVLEMSPTTSKRQLKDALALRADAARVTYNAAFRDQQLKRFPSLGGYDLPDWFIDELLWLPDDASMSRPSEFCHLATLIERANTSDEVAAVNTLMAHFRINGI
jgi:hypothetical protein